jgi:hypothetical protein
LCPFKKIDNSGGPSGLYQLKAVSIRWPPRRRKVVGPGGSNAELSNARYILGKFRRICANDYYFGAALRLPLVLWTGEAGFPVSSSGPAPRPIVKRAAICGTLTMAGGRPRLVPPGHHGYSAIMHRSWFGLDVYNFACYALLLKKNEDLFGAKAGNWGLYECRN